MAPTLCLIGGCNGAGKTTLAKELLPRLGLMRFLNADEIARGLSPLDPSLCAFKAGRLVIEEARAMVTAGASFALESTLSGKTYVAMLREAKARGFRVVLHYVMIGSAQQAVERVRLRVSLGGHDVPQEDIVRRYGRSLRHLLDDYLPLADEWGVWENWSPPPQEIATDRSHSIPELRELLTSLKVMEPKPSIPTNTSAIVLEAGRVATEKMLDYYKRMGVRVTPQMTLAPEPKRRAKKAATAD
ncbi:MAG TPA: zeta toxin family protein [Bacteroidia bacterium]|nr:zeta toxin family protein [Bacteroidia bacterium]